MSNGAAKLFRHQEHYARDNLFSRLAMRGPICFSSWARKFAPDVSSGFDTPSCARDFDPGLLLNCPPLLLSCPGKRVAYIRPRFRDAGGVGLGTVNSWRHEEKERRTQTLAKTSLKGSRNQRFLLTPSFHGPIHRYSP